MTVRSLIGRVDKLEQAMPENGFKDPVLLVCDEHVPSSFWVARKIAELEARMRPRGARATGLHELRKPLAPHRPRRVYPLA